MTFATLTSALVFAATATTFLEEPAVVSSFGGASTTVTPTLLIGRSDNDCREREEEEVEKVKLSLL